MNRPVHNLFYCFASIISALANIHCSSTHSKMDNMNYSAKEIGDLGKKSIVKIAKELIINDCGEKIPDSYDARVFAKDSSVIVLFDLPIHFVAKNTAFYYGVSVDLISKSFSYMPIINTETEIEDSRHFPFYEPTKEDMKTIEFVLGGTTSFKKHKGLLNEKDETTTIIETDTFYDVESLYKSQSTRYKVDKVTGIRSEQRHRHIKTESLLQQGYSEIIK